MHDTLSERIIEDILSADKSILAELLSASPVDLSLVGRQKSVTSGKIDLLYLHQDELLLIELKIVGFYDGVIDQINGYYEDLKELQRQRRLVDAAIRKVVLVTAAISEDFAKCREHSIQLLTYEPETVLSRYYENFRELSQFLKIQSSDYGVVRLGLIKSTLYLLSKGKDVEEICGVENRAQKTIENRLRVSALLNLVVKYKHDYFLTDFGNLLLQIGDLKVDDRFNDKQVEKLSEFVKENPFFSSITYTIFTILETVFVLAKNQYPVPNDAVIDYFVKSVGKGQTWKTRRARETATYIFSNYACELQLLAKIGNSFYLTPKGIQSILLLQLNRSIKLIESQK